MTKKADQEKIFQWINDLTHPLMRENALNELYKNRKEITDLAPVLWHSFGTVAALLQEITNIYPAICPATLTAQQSIRACNMLGLLQCIASHPKTRSVFMQAQIPLFLLPLLQTESKAQPFDFLKLTALNVIKALVKNNDTDAVIFLVTSDILPICWRIMEFGSELNQSAATYILQKILLNDEVLSEISKSYTCFMNINFILDKMVTQLVKQPSTRLLKQVVLCFLRLCRQRQGHEFLSQGLPYQLRDETFAACLRDDKSIRHVLAVLLKRLGFNTVMPIVLRPIAMSTPVIM